jgi:hypothetical protein
LGKELLFWLGSNWDGRDDPKMLRLRSHVKFVNGYGLCLKASYNKNRVYPLVDCSVINHVYEETKNNNDMLPVIKEYLSLRNIRTMYCEWGVLIAQGYIRTCIHPLVES